jgi:hypothetical protein
MRDSFTCNVRFSGFLLAGSFFSFSFHEYSFPFGVTHVVSSTCDRIYSGNHFCPRAIYCLRRSYGHVCHFNRFKDEELIKQDRCWYWPKFQGATSTYAPWNDVCSTTCIQRGTSTSPLLHLPTGQVAKNIFYTFRSRRLSILDHTMILLCAWTFLRNANHLRLYAILNMI